MDLTARITRVSKTQKHYSIHTDSDWSFDLETKYEVIPKIGDTIQLLFTTNGSVIRGCLLNGELIYYKNDEELKEERRKWLENNTKAKLELFEKEKEGMDADYEALPPIFKKRIDRFRKNNPNFRVEFEAYELFCCKEAIKIAEACKTPEAVENFYDMSWESQKKQVPELAEGHSGNTFGMACALARDYLIDKDRVAQRHGALSHLVGSEDYGD